MTEYRLELREPRGIRSQEWRGRATHQKLSEYIDEYYKSLQVGGENHFKTRARGYTPTILAARIVTKKTGKVVAEWRGYTLMSIKDWGA